MRFVRSRKRIILSAIALCAALLSGCGSRADRSLLGTFRMGEKVQVATLTYIVLETEWKNSLTPDGTGTAPKDRYLIVRLSAQNTGNAAATMPTMELVAPDKHTYTELTQGIQDVPNWLGLLRNVQPGKTEQGRVVFDAPIGAYKLMISDTSETGSEKYA